MRFRKGWLALVFSFAASSGSKTSVSSRPREGFEKHHLALSWLQTFYERESEERLDDVVWKISFAAEEDL